jgi:phosphoadenosine phosphosulfate reductase
VPLARALAGAGAWVTGLRREQNVTRAGVEVDEHDPLHGIAKVNPLAHWSHDDVGHYLRAHDVPVNALHARGYPSIGCAPCTTPVEPGEDARAGRWRHLRVLSPESAPSYCRINFTDGGGI